MSEWYKVTLPYSEAGIAGKGKLLQDAFEVVFIANRAPNDAAMFSRRSDDFKNVSYYFTPGATRIAEGIILSYSGVECPAPTYDNHIALMAGNAGAHDEFLKKKGTTIQ